MSDDQGTMKRLAALTLLLGGMLLLSACGGGQGEARQPEEPAQSASAERFGFIRSVSTAGGTVTIAFDEADWLSGDAAQRAAEEDGAIGRGDPVPNDYYVRNADPATQSLEVAAEAEITAERCQLCRNGEPGNLVDFVEAFGNTRQSYADPYRGADSLYWLTIEDGRVVRIDEQYRP
jgi:hypothetical protein